jgi:uncharacterized hydrophobic protein (TIGR00271 family)
VIHLRIVSPPDRSDQVVHLLSGSRSACNVIRWTGVVHDPAGADLIMADVAREDASVLLSDLKDLRLHEDGSISIEDVEAVLSDRAEKAIQHARGAPSDAVVWEEVEARTSEATELSAGFLLFMVLAGLIAAVGIFLNSPILIVGAMVVGPEFGPMAGLCVAVATRRRDVAARSALALALGFPAAITAVFVATLLFKLTGLTPDTFTSKHHQLANIISSPDFFAFFVAACAGTAGMLSLSTAKSGALIGVLISVTTIPAAANVGIAAAYGDWAGWAGSMRQLAVNVASILVFGTLTLVAQRALYDRRRRRHLREDPERRAGGLPPDRGAAPQPPGAVS